jgi:hypothetical protein
LPSTTIEVSGALEAVPSVDTPFRKPCLELSTDTCADCDC